MIKVCPKCGYQNVEAAKFCVHCGAPLGAATDSSKENSSPVATPVKNESADMTGGTPANNPYQQFNDASNKNPNTGNTNPYQQFSDNKDNAPAPNNGNAYQQFQDTATPKQPQVSSIQDVEQTGTTSFFRRHKNWFIAAGIAIFAIILFSALNGGFNTDNSSGSEEIADGIKKDILNSSDYGDATVSWSKSVGYVIHISSDSTVLENLNDGSPSIWNSLARDVQDESKALSDKGSASAISIQNPDNSSRYYLQVNNGKIRYNVADDLN
ncbi:zinc ribbon domain-containing protein [Schleiferilactobacillus perolens]|jgi:hypothetical protein|uniref:zinc ribbon domain-containing protein n=1 Tax=Schleiferilactobacillus perolens TaxID=100468 RepID=UPI0023565374|nr:zinc ribbon domain-containing protein [Schleiferilactobacillus perolens]MCI2172212.1 zinc ribbon domain-containing protein [Schleiferilactobacillus perolens]